ncbi:MAG: low molecular weight phosphotyrosine protein phosphatase [Lentisphaeria bacterium]|nr:low molecular weight phosphotyrosine protein phosphatase [Lentisphaeria bacterium]
MIKILFVCHGNICRSPMAEFVMKKMICDANLTASFFIASAATSSEELGNGVYPPVKRLLAEHNISCAGKQARQLTAEDYEDYDFIIGMDFANVRNITRICNGDPSGKVRMLLEFTDPAGEVADPWYTGKFNTTWDEVNIGCAAWLAECKKILEEIKK